MTAGKYNRLYAAKTAKLIFIFSISVSALFLLAALISGNSARGLVASAIPIAVGLLIWFAFLLRITLANALLKKQISSLNIKFDDSNAKPLYPSAMIFFIRRMVYRGRKTISAQEFYTSCNREIEQNGYGLRILLRFQVRRRKAQASHGFKGKCR